MSATARGRLPWVLLGALAVLTGGAAYLGVAQGPPAGPSGRWAALVATTDAAGPFTFTMTVRTTGDANTFERISGTVDFATADATETTVERGSGISAQWSETEVVHGVAYLRLGADLSGRLHYPSFWLRIPTSDVSFPLGSLGSGSSLPTIPEPAQLHRIGRATVADVPTTEYRFEPVAISCPDAPAGRPTYVTNRTRVWVDQAGRIRRLASAVDERLGGKPFDTSTVVTVGSFGVPLAVQAPRRAVGSAASATTPPKSNPLAGCLVTPY